MAKPPSEARIPQPVCGASRIPLGGSRLITPPSSGIPRIRLKTQLTLPASLSTNRTEHPDSNQQLDSISPSTQCKLRQPVFKKYQSLKSSPSSEFSNFSEPIESKTEPRNCRLSQDDSLIFHPKLNSTLLDVEFTASNNIYEIPKHNNVTYSLNIKPKENNTVILKSNSSTNCDQESSGFSLKSLKENTASLLKSFKNSSISFTHKDHDDNIEINENAIGKRVLVGESEYGTLLYLGSVQFESSGSKWCGVELENPVGKHNGMVKGVRYFSCKENHGIIAPFSKVQLASDSKSKFAKLKSKFEQKASSRDNGKSPVLTARKRLPNVDCNETKIIEDKSEKRIIHFENTDHTDSGPYSMLEINPNNSKSDCIEEQIFLMDSGSSASDTSKNDTVIYIPNNDIDKQRSLKRLQQYSVEEIDPKRRLTEAVEDDIMEDDFPIISNERRMTHTIEHPIILPSQLEAGKPLIDNLINDKTYDVLNVNETFHVTDNTNKNDDAPKILVEPMDTHPMSLTLKRPNLELPINGAVKKVQQISPISRLNFSLDKIIKLSGNSSDASGIINESFPSLSPSELNQVEKVSKPSKSPLPGPHCLSKQNSFEHDESLGILTPDQMCEFPKTPSTDDLSSLLADSKQSDKTISNHSPTPSSENIGAAASQNCLVQYNSANTETVDIVKDNKVELIIQEDENYDTFIIRPFKTCDVIELISPNVAENSTVDLSLGLLDEEMLEETRLISDCTGSNLDTTINMDLPFDSVEGNSKGNLLKQVLRCEQTPSPEELPLDPVGVKTDYVEIGNASIDQEPKTDASKSTTKTSNSFITSITSIMSLDTGYQGDGEMSRPASRGGDHSPTVHKPSNPGLVGVVTNQWNRAVSRRQDPMTDSDFFTESDADGHDENAPRGDRRVQVIDGQLYGLNAQNIQADPEEMFVNNQNQIGEEMDSSGIFTDLETNTRADESDMERNRNNVDKLLPVHGEEDQSPSDVSTKTISENSQEIPKTQDISSDNLEKNDNILLEDDVAMDTNRLDSSRNSIVSRGRKNSSGQSSQCSISSRSAKKINDETVVKKHKMPNRNVVSKVKSMLESSKTNDENQENRKPTPRKVNNKWDAVMSKISDGKSKPNLKEVKSKVAAGISSAGSVRKTVLGKSSSSNVKSTNAASKPKSRRTRTRSYETACAKSSAAAAHQQASSGSINSSLSDISNSCSAPARPPASSAASPTTSTLIQSPAARAKKREALVTRCSSPPGGIQTSRTITASPRTNGISAKKTSQSSVIQANNNANSGGVATSRRVNPRRGATPAVSQTSSKPASPAKDSNRVVTSGSGKGSGRGGVASQQQSAARGGGAAPASGGGSATPTAVVVVNGAAATNTSATSLTQRPSQRERESQQAARHAALGVEALAVLLQHLVLQYDVFKTPSLRRELESTRNQWVSSRLELEEIRAAYRRLEDAHEVTEHELDAERIRHIAEIRDLQDEKQSTILQLTENLAIEKSELEERLQERLDLEKSKYDYSLSNKEKEFSSHIEVIKRDHESKLNDLITKYDKLKIDYGNIREEYDCYKSEVEQLKNGFNEKENQLTKKCDEYIKKYNTLKEEFELKEIELVNRLCTAEKRVALLEEQSKKIVEGFKNETKDTKLQTALSRCTQLQDETESLRTVLELKQNEISELRRAHEETKEAAKQLLAAQVRTQALQARVEDLELQLERKNNLEKTLSHENKVLIETVQQETQRNSRILLQNEELQWKLKQNSEFLNTFISLHGSNHSLIEENLTKSPRAFNRTLLQSSSFSEKHSRSMDRNNTTRSAKVTFMSEKKTSSTTGRKIDDENKGFRTVDNFQLEDISPPSSPKIKAVVEKNDSVSYVLEMEEPPEVLANRIYRRSFRNPTPPKNTPSKSPTPRRQKCKTNHPLSLSSSATTVSAETHQADKRVRSQSVSAKLFDESPNGKDDFLSNSWTPDITSTPCNLLLDLRKEVRRVELGPSEIELDSMNEDLIIGSNHKDDDNDDVDLELSEHVHMSLPALPSELTRSQQDKKQDLPTAEDLRLLHVKYPKHSAGEAMISESNSEDECSTSTSSDRSHSISDMETSDDLAKTAAAITRKTNQMQENLAIMTGSANSETMDYSWSDDISSDQL